MKAISKICYPWLLLLCFSCSNNTIQKSTIASASSPEITSLKTKPRDTTKLYTMLNDAFKSDSDRILTRTKLTNDTLTITTTGWEFYYPFGKIKNLSKLKSVFAGYKYAEETTDNSLVLHRFYKDSSFVKFIKSDDGDSYEIVSGLINSNDLIIDNHIAIGMSQENFYKLFFKQNVANYLEGVKIIEIITTVRGVWHYYVFSGGKLLYVKFSTDYQVNQK